MRFEVASGDIPGACADYDATVIVFTDATDDLTAALCGPDIHTACSQHAAINAGFYERPQLLPTGTGSRLVLAPTGPLTRDYDDVRRVGEAAAAGCKLAMGAGATRPLLVLSSHKAHAAFNPRSCLPVALLGAMQAAYVPLEFVEHFRAKNVSVTGIESAGFAVLGADYGADTPFLHRVAAYVNAIESGRTVARHITECDPERMAAPRAVEYIRKAFEGVPNVTVSVVTDRGVLEREYPLLAAVARASWAVERHRPAIVTIEYKSPDQSLVKENLFLVGKGITYDTGGADVKYGGSMRGMSRDKGGAGAAAGFMKTISELKTKSVNACAMLAFVRNSIGADSYVSDEVILSRAGVRVLVGNTDAEGRMVMSDLLADVGQRALKCQANSTTVCRLFTIATLTGHVIRAYGSYPACLDNGPALQLDRPTTRLLSETGEQFGEPWEVSTLRRDDYKMVSATSQREDVIQCNTAASTMTARGHQFPAAFMLRAAGLDKHGRDQLDPRQRLAYTHLDIAGAVEGDDAAPSGSLGTCTGAPVTSLTAAFVPL